MLLSWTDVPTVQVLTLTSPPLHSTYLQTQVSVACMESSGTTTSVGLPRVGQTPQAVELLTVAELVGCIVNELLFDLFHVSKAVVFTLEFEPSCD